MHQSPLKQLGAPRRAKYAELDMLEDTGGRPQRSTLPKARKFQREEGPREDRGRQHPRG
jgi:hypothetical protein